MPSFWLVKSEPAKYAFADLMRDGKTVWTASATTPPLCI